MVGVVEWPASMKRPMRPKENNNIVLEKMVYWQRKAGEDESIEGISKRITKADMQQ